MDQTQVMRIFKRMHSTCLIESLKHFLSECFVDDINIEIQETLVHSKPKIKLGFDLDTEQNILQTQHGNIQFGYDMHGEPVFRAVEVTRMLRYKDSDQAIRNHVNQKYCVLVVYNSKHESAREVIPGKGIWIRESGLYSLLIRSKMPYARAFQDWIFETVLPAIRRTGQFSIPTLPVVTNEITQKKITPTPKIGLVYFIHMDNNMQVFKIGFSTDFKKRFHNLQCAHPFKLHVYATIKNVLKEKEDELHQFFEKQRVRGEWFAITTDMIDAVLNA